LDLVYPSHAAIFSYLAIYWTQSSHMFFCTHQQTTLTR